MTEVAFDLAKARLAAAGQSYEAARMVLVDGTSVTAAARATKVRRQVVYHAIERIKGAFATLDACAYCGQKFPPV